MYEGIQRVFPRSVASPVIPTRPQDNAIRHTPGGTPITLSTRGAVTGPGGQSSVELTVRDHGAGLPASLIAWLSTPEQPTDPADAAGTDGGLGLLFVKSVVGLLGGRISARGDATSGTTIVVTFPTVRQSPVDEWRQRQP